MCLAADGGVCVHVLVGLGILLTDEHDVHVRDYDAVGDLGYGIPTTYVQCVGRSARVSV